MPPLDPGSVLVAAMGATAGAGLVDAAARRAGAGRQHLAFVLGELMAAEPLAAYAVGLSLHLASNTLWALGFAAVWSATGWPIAPLQGALFALVPWALGALRLPERVLPATTQRIYPVRGEALTRLLSTLAFGALVGFIYRPGS